MSFSSNAEPTKNGKISMVNPIVLPGILRYLGQIRAEFIIGKLGGEKYASRPWFNAQKVSFKLTENLELGFTRWSIFWGVGHPITLNSFIDNFTSFSSPAGTSAFNSANDPGDRKAGFDFRYRIPGLRDWLTLYADAYSDDDPSPLAAPRRAAISPGLYLTRVPGVPHLDLRIEAASTEVLSQDRGCCLNYYNDQYRMANTNYGDFVGNSAGRDGRAIEGWATYRFSARSKFELGTRELKISAKFVPGGGTQSDETMKYSHQFANSLSAQSFFQYERFYIPVLGGPQHNLSGWLQMTWEPKIRIPL